MPNRKPGGFSDERTGWRQGINNGPLCPHFIGGGWGFDCTLKDGICVGRRDRRCPENKEDEHAD